jgi:hypothetical protein
MTILVPIVNETIEVFAYDQNYVITPAGKEMPDAIAQELLAAWPNKFDTPDMGG